MREIKRKRLKYMPGDPMKTMDILAIISRADSFKTTEYLCRLSCGCEDSIVILTGHKIYGREKNHMARAKNKAYKCCNCMFSGHAKVVPKKSFQRDKEKLMADVINARENAFYIALFPPVSENFRRKPRRAFL